MRERKAFLRHSPFGRLHVLVDADGERIATFGRDARAALGEARLCALKVVLECDCLAREAVTSKAASAGRKARP